MEETNLLVDGYPIRIRYDKRGRWQYDQVELYEALDDIDDNRAASLINYIYEEGYIVDRRINTNIVDKEGNARQFKP